MNLRILLASLFVLLIVACGPRPETDPARSAEATEAGGSRGDTAARARAIARGHIIVDGHIDVPDRLAESWEDVSVATEQGDFDYPRAVAGGLNAPFMSIYTAARLEAEGRSKQVADGLIDLVERIVSESPDKFAIAVTPAEVEQHFEAGLMSLPLGMENGAPLEGDLANLEHFYDRGVRYITLTHSLSNHLSDSSYDDNKRWGGLSEFGAEAVRAMNRMGIMVDVSHVSDEAFYDVMEISSAPVIASHSSARHFTPGWERNMSDEMIVRLAENGGVIMINFGSAFITEEARAYGSARSDAWDAWLEAEGLESSDERRDEFYARYAAEHGPYPYATLAQTLDHFDHVAALTGGAGHLGIGSDYDGVGDSLPVGLKNVASYPNLVAGLLERGYSEADVVGILGGNLLRVWREVEAAAARAGN